MQMFGHCGRAGFYFFVAHLFIQQGPVVGFIEVGAQEQRQPDTLVGMRHLIDIFQLRIRMQQNPVRHFAALMLLRQRGQQSGSGHVRRQIRHAHMVLQVVSRLWICGQPVYIAMVINLAWQPLIDEVIQPAVRCTDLNSRCDGRLLRPVRLHCRGKAVGGR